MFSCKNHLAGSCCAVVQVSAADGTKLWQQPRLTRLREICCHVSGKRQLSVVRVEALDPSDSLIKYKADPWAERQGLKKHPVGGIVFRQVRKARSS